MSSVFFNRIAIAGIAVDEGERSDSVNSIVRMVGINCSTSILTKVSFDTFVHFLSSVSDDS
jgi:hypothetical protein